MATAPQSRSPETRGRLIDAAINTILEQGFYRASSNAIAERAGLSWGVIQYHFGTRENLMLGVLQEAAARLQQTLSAAVIEPAPLAGRLEQLSQVLAAYYGQPSFVAFTEVLLNLSRDPRTSERTRESLQRINEPVGRELGRLTGAVLSGTGSDDEVTRSLVFHALRGLSISEVMLGAQPGVTSPSSGSDPLPALLAQALSGLIAGRREQ